MSELNPDDSESLLNFFILQTLSQASLPGFAIEQHTQRVYRLLELAAERKGNPGPGSFSAALQRLERAGWVEAGGRPADLSSEKIYALTSTGREQLQAQRAGWTSTLARYIDAGRLDDSFQSFLNREP